MTARGAGRYGGLEGTLASLNHVKNKEIGRSHGIESYHSIVDRMNTIIHVQCKLMSLKKSPLHGTLFVRENGPNIKHESRTKILSKKYVKLLTS